MIWIGSMYSAVYGQAQDKDEHKQINWFQNVPLSPAFSVEIKNAGKFTTRPNTALSLPPAPSTASWPKILPKFLNSSENCY